MAGKFESIVTICKPKPNYKKEHFKQAAYGDGDLAVISAGLAEAKFEDGAAISIVLDEFLALEDQVIGELTIEFSAEDEVSLARLLAAFLHHETGAVGLVVHAVSKGRGDVAGLDAARLAGEFESEVNRVTGGVGQRLEDLLVLLRVPFLLGFLNPLLLAGFDLIAPDGVQESLGVKVASQGSIEL